MFQSRGNPKTQCSQLTSVNQVVGTIGFMSPEQFESTDKVDARSDLYSLGVTLFNMLTGHLPQDLIDVSGQVGKVLTIPRSGLPSLATIRSDLPPTLVDLVDQLLAYDPEQRPASAAEVAERLEPFANGCDLKSLHTRTANHDTASHQDFKTEVTSPSSPTKPPTAKPTTGPRRLWIILAVTFLLLLTGLFSVYTFKTPRGTLVVETGPGVTVELLEAAGVRLLHKKTGQTYELQIGKQQQNSGEYLIDVRQPETGLQFSAKQFSIDESGEKVVLVTLKPATPKKPDAIKPPNESPENEMPPEFIIKPGNAGRVLATKNWTGTIHKFHFSADNKSLFVSAVDSPVVLFETETLAEVRRFEGHEIHSRAMVTSKDNALLYSGDGKGRVLVHEIATGKLVKELNPGG
ncbi:MAG: hypothetical protein KDA84_25535, partial [Planctomycetaceae bacterium]|nr:hypothetical protein [Planctomycetaceae bacterium]